MYEAHLRGMLAALAPRNFPDADVIVVRADGSLAALVQVKTRTRGRDGGWHMQEKHERRVLDRLFYCFVDLESPPPTTHIIPSAVVAGVIADAHRVWLAQPPKRGSTPHKDTPMRRILPDYGSAVPSAPRSWMAQWKDRWDLLGG
jgi:hypothetical protein